MIDTTMTSFQMRDNYGITDEFTLDIYHYLNPWGTDGRASGEAFGVSYASVVNRFLLSFYLRAGIESSSLIIDWNNYDHFMYDFSTMEVYASETEISYGDSTVIRSAVEPSVDFYNSLEVNGILYKNIIEINYSGEEDAIEDNTPVISYFSGGKGLVRFVLKNGVVFERIE